MILKFLYSFFLPPGCFIILQLGFTIWIYNKQKKVAQALLLLTFLLYSSSIPFTSDFLLHLLEDKYAPPQSFEADVIIMTGIGATPGRSDIDGLGQLSGSGANRILTAARLHRITGLPILLSGGQVFADTGNESQIAKRQLIGIGIPGDKIIVEDRSLSTKENARFTRDILDINAFKKPLLVVSAFHMERTKLNFEKVGVNVIPYPTDYQTAPSRVLYINKFAPSYDAMAGTGTALREYLGIAALSLVY